MNMIKKIAMIVAAVVVIALGYMMVHVKATPTNFNAPAVVYKGQ
jgi:hypothetical protein